MSGECVQCVIAKFRCKTWLTRRRWAACLWGAPALLALGGCAAVKVTPNPIDSPSPAVAMSNEAVYCLGLAVNQPLKIEDGHAERLPRNERKPSTLGAGKSCWFVVQSDAPDNATGLKLDAQSNYKVTIPAGQFWFDADRQVPAPKGDHGTWFTRLFSYAKQHPKLHWFAVMANLCGDKTQAKHIKRPAGSEGEDVIATLEGMGGELCFYVNDVPGYYENNHGRIWLKITAP